MAQPRPSHEMKPGQVPATESETAAPPKRKFPEYPFFRSGPNKGKRRYPNPRVAAREAAKAAKAQPTGAAVKPAPQGARAAAADQAAQHRAFLERMGRLPSAAEITPGSPPAPKEQPAATAATVAPPAADEPTRRNMPRPTPPAPRPSLESPSESSQASGSSQEPEKK